MLRSFLFRRTAALCACLLLISPLFAATAEPSSQTPQVTLKWTSPTTHTDGSRLRDLAGFRLHVGKQSGKYDEVIDVGLANSYRFTRARPDVRYFVAVSAYTKDRVESALSGEVVVPAAGDSTRSVGSQSTTALGSAGDPQPDPTAYEFVISSGLVGGGYHEVATQLAAVLDRYKNRSKVLASQGSLQNLKRLAATTDMTNIALAQADVLRAFLDGAPEQGDSTFVVDAWGEECLFAIVSAQSDLKSDRDLKRRDVSIAVAGPESGPAATLRYLKGREPAFGGIRLVYLPPEQALSQLSAEAPGKGIDAVLLVQHPKARPPAMQSVLDSIEQYRFLTIKARGIDARLPSGDPVYKRAQITPVPMSGIGVETVCTKRLLLGSKAKLGEARLAMLTKLVKSHWRDIYVRPAAADR